MSESELHNQESQEPQGSSASGASRRRGSLINFLEAIKIVNTASTAESVRQRFSDYVSIGLVVVCILSLVAAVALPVPAGFKLLPLVFTIGAVIFYIINRLGIIVSMTPRQALIVWQIVIAAFWLGVTSSMLVMIFCIYFFSQGGAH